MRRVNVNAAEPLQPISRSAEIEGFIDTLFEGQEGYVYTPTKNPESGYWQPYFFQWPKQKTAIVTHILDQTKSKECYVSPSIWKAPNPDKPAWKGSHFVWLEFDGNAPNSLPAGIPEPTIRVQSSTKQHEHWYWRLKDFETNSETLEGLSKALTYTLDADKSGWDCTQVLRPPGTIHHDSKRRVALLLSRNTSYSFGDFTNLATAPESVVSNTTFTEIPEIQSVIAKYKWSTEALELFRRDKQVTGSRSSAMTRLGFECVEMGMTNEECYAILLNADDRWGKYKTRTPESRAKVLIGIITHCRGQKSIQVELSLSDTLANIYSWDEFKQAKIEAPTWLFDGFLAENGLGVIGAAPGVGKSTLMLFMCMQAVLGKRFLKWSFNPKAKQIKAAFISFEMQASECIGFLDTIEHGYHGDDLLRLQSNFFIIPEGVSTDLSKKENQQEVLDRLLSRDINFVVFDSLKAMTNVDDHKSDVFFDWVQTVLRKEYGMTVLVIHHNRKAPNAKTERTALSLDDLYGGMGITTYPTTVFALQPRSMKNLIDFVPLKVRSAELPEKFTVKRMPHLQLELADELTTKELEKKEAEENIANTDDGTESDSTLFS